MDSPWAVLLSCLEQTSRRATKRQPSVILGLDIASEGGTEQPRLLVPIEGDLRYDEGEIMAETMTKLEYVPIWITAILIRWRSPAY